MKPYILLDLISIVAEEGMEPTNELAAFLMFPQNPRQLQEEMPSNLLQISPCPSYYTTKPIWNKFVNDMKGKANQLRIELYFAPAAWEKHSAIQKYVLVEEYAIKFEEHECFLDVKFDDGHWSKYPISYFNVEMLELSENKIPIIAELLRHEGVSNIQVPVY